MWWWWTRKRVSAHPDTGQQCLSSQHASPGSKLLDAESGMCLRCVDLSWRVGTCGGHVEEWEVRLGGGGQRRVYLRHPMWEKHV